MSTNLRGSTAYKQTMRETENPRTIERRVFSQITRQLEKIDISAATPLLTDTAHDALSRNQQLWGSLMFDVMQDENPLPKELKAGIISLALFVDRHTPEVLAGRKDVTPLVTINKNLMAGLAGDAAPSEAVAGA